MATRYSYAFLALWSAVYFAATCYRASRKLFWFDELYTIYISVLPRFGDIWYVETHGVDYNPPLFYLITRASMRVFGNNQLGARMPEIIGFWVFCICLYRLVSKRTNALTGFVAMSIPAVTMAYFYAYEARPHGIVLGFGGLAFIGWQAAADGSGRRWLPLALMGFSLACGLLNHSYAFVWFAPIGVGELVRLAYRRRIDIPMYLTLAASGCFVLVSLPLLRSAVASLPPNFFRPKITLLVHTYEWLFAPATTLLWIALCLLALASLTRREPPRVAAGGFRPWELAAAAGTLLVPLVVFSAAYITKAPFFDRYALAAVLAVASLAALAFWKNPVAGLLCLVVAFGLFAENLREFRAGSFISEPTTGYPIATRLSELQDTYKWMESDPHRDLPIALLDELTFAPLLYYAPPELKDRLAYRPATTEQTGWGWLALQKCCHATGVVLFSKKDTKEPAPDRFLAYSTPRSTHWVADIKSEGATVTADKVSHEDFLFLVEYGGSPALGQR